MSKRGNQIAGALIFGLLVALVGALSVAADEKPRSPEPGPTVTASSTETVTKKPKPRTVTATATATIYRASRDQDRAASPGGPTEAQWAALRRCEAGAHGLYRANIGNGYYGAYQFDLSTWRGVGGTGLPSGASPAEQDKRALILYADRGAQPWPVCGKYLR